MQTVNEILESEILACVNFHRIRKLDNFCYSVFENRIDGNTQGIFLDNLKIKSEVDVVVCPATC